MGLLNETQSALCDMYDVRNALPDKIKNQPKDNDGSEITVGQCIDDVILFLEELETNMMSPEDLYQEKTL